MRKFRNLRGGFRTTSFVNLAKPFMPTAAQVASYGAAKLSGTKYAFLAPYANMMAKRYAKPGQFKKDLEFIKQGTSGIKSVAKNLANPEGIAKGSLFAPVIYNHSGTVTKSDYVLGTHTRYENKLDQKFVLNKMDSYRQACVLGKQAVQSFQVLDAYELSKIYSDLNQASISTVTSANNAASRMHYSSVNLTLRMTNGSNMAILLHIYECEPTKYTVTTIGGGQTQYVTSPVAAWDYGENIQYPGSQVTFGSSPSYENVGTKPFNIDGFNQFWRVRTIQQVELTPGSTHVHNSVYNINSLFHSAELIPGMTQTLGTQVPSFTNITGSIPGFTKSVMIVFSGIAVHDKTTPSSVTTASCSLDIVKTATYKVRTRFANNVVIATQNNLPAVADANAEQYVVQTPTDTTVSTH